MIEELVNLFENVMLGKINDEGVREGGILEYLYNSIVKDSTFILIVQLSLILYMVFFGIGVLGGFVEITRKELMKRILKLSLVIFFTTPTSWYWYNEIVVGFFKDSMDAIITMVMNLSDTLYENSTITAVAGASSGSGSEYATRFSYIDNMIKLLFSEPVTKKIWGLFFGNAQPGVLLIMGLYALIGYFVYIMITAAIVYITAMLKLVFVLALGPLFMLTSLFSQMEGMFKKWLAFLVARSFEVIFLFTILYMFISLIHDQFVSLLSVRTCLEDLTEWKHSFVQVYKTQSDLSFGGWVVGMATIAGLLFLMVIIMKKIPGLAAQLVSISGTTDPAGDDGTAGFANNMVSRSAFGMSDAVSGAMATAIGIKAGAGGAGAMALIGGAAMVAGRGAARGLRVGSKLLNLTNDGSTRVSGPKTFARDRVIDSEIKKQIKAAKAKGLVGEKLNKEVRKQLLKSVNSRHFKTRKSVLGIRGVNIDHRCNEMLIKRPLQELLKNEARNMRKHGVYGDKARQLLKEKARTEFGYANKEVLNGYLNNMKSLTRVEIDTKNAARLIGQGKLDRNEYMAHLQKKKLRMQKDREGKGLKALGNKIKAVGHFLRKDEKYNVSVAENRLNRKLHHEDRRGDDFLSRNRILNSSMGLNPLKRIEGLDRMVHGKEYQEEKRAAYKALAKEYFNKDGGESMAQRERRELGEWYDREKKAFENHESEFATKSALEREKKDREEVLNRQEKAMMVSLEDPMSKAEYEQMLANGLQGADAVAAQAVNAQEQAALAQQQEEQQAWMSEQEKVEAAQEAQRLKELQDKEAELFDNLLGVGKDHDNLLPAEAVHEAKSQMKEQYASKKEVLTAKADRLGKNLDKREKELQSLQGKKGKDDKEQAEIDKRLKELGAEIDYVKGQISANDTQMTMVESQIRSVSSD